MAALKSIFFGIPLLTSFYAWGQSGTSLEETTKFLKENITKNDERVTEVSCNKIERITRGEDREYGEQEDFVVAFNPREVDYKVHEFGEDRNKQILAKCLSGSTCVRIRGGYKPDSSDAIFAIPIAYERVLKALEHHQDLCGGKLDSPF